MKDDAPLPFRLLSRYLRTMRKRQAESYRASCTMY
jgi:hypothetical protein